jgi:uncharacterized membrane protein
MKLHPILLLHICGATIGLLSGYLAIVLRKGSGLHRAAGTVFVAAMVSMSVSAAWVAWYLRPNMLNFTVSLLTFYLVVTGWRAGRKRAGGTGAVDLGALLFVAGVGVMGVGFGIEAASSAGGTKNGMPAPIYFVFGTIALLCAVTDVRMLRRGGVTGSPRMVRHLWRLGLALLIATMSFYPGQAKLLPASVRETPLVFAPHILLIVSMIVYRIRFRTRKRAETITTVAPAGIASRVSA